MILLLTGENSYEIEHELQRLIAAFDGTSERYDGALLETRQLPDLLTGRSLFAENRLVIIRGLSENRHAWDVLPDYLSRMDDDSHLILVDPKPDKRTKTYKVLQKRADVKEFKLWGERETATAERWTERVAGELEVTLKSGAARLVVSRAMVAGEKATFIDQWRIASSLKKLAPLKEVTTADVERYIDAAPVESVFGLLETALKGERARLKQMLERLETSEDPFRLFGLLGGQVFLLAALSVHDSLGNDAAKELGAHPFVMNKLSPYAKRLGPAGSRRVMGAFAEADIKMKTSAIEPWILIERALMKSAVA